MSARARTTLRTGDLLRFVHSYDVLKYGQTATVIGYRPTVGSFPSGTLVDLRTSNGTELQRYLRNVRGQLRLASPAQPCGSGWTGDRCTKTLGHRGLHSNERSGR